MALLSLHNHTPFSDGIYSIDEIVEAHLALPDCCVDGIGISDHLFRTPTSRECANDAEFARVFANETRTYVEHVQAARQRWEGRARIFCGCEINWPLNRKHMPAVRSLLNGLDYVLFEYCDWAGLTELAHQSRLFSCPIGLANMRPARDMPTTSLEQVVRTMANARIFYEINASFRPLSERDAWFAILPKHRVRVALGLDTHDDIEIVRALPELAAYADRRELSGQLFEPSLAAPAFASAN